MMRLNLLFCSALWASGVSGAAISQQPLRTGTFGSADDALAELKEVVGDRLFPAVPVGNPCFTNPGMYNATECQRVYASKWVDHYLSDQPTGYFWQNWAGCQATSDSCALPYYDQQTEIPKNATCHRGNLPELIVEARSVKDVQASFTYASKVSKPVVIKNTGHDWKGRSAGAGSLALWMHKWRGDIVLEEYFRPRGPNCGSVPKMPVFHIQPGEDWESIYTAANKTKYSVVGGTCGSVGIAGWIHGGGHSPLTAVHGMGADNLREIEIVTPDGKHQVASECENRDLFFAVRGGGGGSFGVVTKFTYRAIPKFQVQSLVANLTSLGRYAPARTQFIELVVNNSIAWAKAGWGGYVKPSQNASAIEIVNPAVSLETAREQMEPLLKFFEDNGIVPELTTFESWYHYFYKRMKPVLVHKGGISLAIGSRLVTEDAVRSKPAAIAKAIDQIHQLPVGLNPLIMLVAPTRFNFTSTSSLHPSWGQAIFSVRVQRSWEEFKEPEVPRQKFRDVHDALQPLRSLLPGAGVSISEADIWEENHADAFWGKANHAELQRIKRTVDPSNLLSVWHGVNYESNDDRFRCYVKPQ